MILRNFNSVSLLAVVGFAAACSDSSTVAPVSPFVIPLSLAGAPFDLSASTITLARGETYQLDASKLNGKDVPAGSISWSSANPGVATIADGLVAAVGVGTTNVSAVRGALSVDVTVHVYDCTVAVLPLGITVGEISPTDCLFPLNGRRSDYFSVAAANGEVIGLQTSGVVGVAGVKEATIDLATGTVFGSRNVGAPFRVIGNGDPLQFYLSGVNATTFGAYQVTRVADIKTHSCDQLTFVVPGASFSASLTAANSCRYNVVYSDFPPAIGKPLYAHRYWVRLTQLKPYTVTVGGLSVSFDPALVVFPNILNGAPVAFAAPNSEVPPPTRSVTFTPSAPGYYLIEVSTGKFVAGSAPENWVNHTGPFTLSVTR